MKKNEKMKSPPDHKGKNMRLLLASPPSALSSIVSTTSSRIAARTRPLSLLPLSPIRIKSNRMNDGDDLCIEKSMPRPAASSLAAAAAKSSTSSGEAVVAPPPAGSKMNTVLFIETGESFFETEVSKGRRRKETWQLVARRQRD